ncbi:uncharacterized protein [Anabrus simplex]|uniref:uncharacterized protein n=1 Tax=Anabrus simplex TaxID=316456 RepID=UPI0035A275DE
MSIEWREWCRLCAKPVGNGCPPFENTDQFLREKIFKYLSISVDNQDELPQTVCESCSERISSFDRYADQCLVVQAMFREMKEQCDDKDSKVGLIREEFLQENEQKSNDEEMIDSKKDIELLAIEADPFIPSDCGGSNAKKMKQKLGRKRMTKQKTVPPKPRSKKLTKIQRKMRNEKDCERRMSSRLQEIAQLQKEFEEAVSNTDAEVKEEVEEIDDGEEDDQDEEFRPTAPKKRGRTPKTLVGAAKRKAKVPRVMVKSNSVEVVDEAKEIANDKEASVPPTDSVECKDDDKAVNESDNNDMDNNDNDTHDQDDEDDDNDDDRKDNGIDEESKDDIENDANSQPSIFRWECHVCNQVFRNWNSLSVHCRQAHEVPAQVVCLCAKVLASRASIIKHRLKHTNAYKFRCEKCEKAFHRKSLYDLHILSHVPKEEQPFVCCKCARRFHCEALLRHHERVHLPREERLIYPCNVCSKKFSSRSNVSAHLKAVHFGERPFVCDQCGHSFTSKGILQEHLTIHSDETPFKCSQCKKSFKTKYRLKIHMDTHRETPYQCPVCPHQLSTRRTLRMHLLVHRDTKAYQCATCGKAFKRSKDLKNHHNLHTGRRPYTCTFCPRTFANGSNCRAHKRKMHPEELRIYEASLAAAAAENDGSGRSEDPLQIYVPPTSDLEHHLPNHMHQQDVNPVLHSSPTPELKPIISHSNPINTHSNPITSLSASDYDRHPSMYNSSGSMSVSMKTSQGPPHIPRSTANHLNSMSASNSEYTSASPQDVSDINRGTLGHMTESSEPSVISSMMGMASASMPRLNDNNSCRNPHQQSRNSQNLLMDQDAGSRNMAAMNLNIRRNMNSASESLLNTSHLSSLAPLNLNVAEMHSNRHQHHLSDSPSLSEMEEVNYMSGARRGLDTFVNSRAHIPNLNSNIQIHRQQQHQSLTSLGRSLAERDMGVPSNLNRMHHGQHSGGGSADVGGLQGYSSLNHLYQHHGESMPSAVAAAIAHSGSMGVPAFPGNPYIHHNMGYSRGSANM